MIYIKTQTDIELIKGACSIWKKTKDYLLNNLKVGMTTNELDKMAGDFIISNNCIPSFLNYSGFPKNICISINEELIHGVGSDRVIRNNDLITFDIGVTYMGHICDSAFSVIVEPNNDMQKQLINNAAKKCLDESVKVAINGNYTGDIGNCIETIAKQNGYEVIKDFGGHGCGNKVHEDPHIPCYGTKGSGVKLIPGMVICIEPMLMTGSDKYYIDSLNDWTVISKNKKLTCHWEHMVLITKDGNEILTI